MTPTQTNKFNRRKKMSLKISALLLLSLSVFAHSQSLNLMQTMGSTNDEAVQDLKIDIKGNIYIVGTRGSGIDSSLGIDTSLISFKDALFHSFIAKFDSTGRKFKGIIISSPSPTLTSYGWIGFKAIDIDSQGFVYVIGQEDFILPQSSLKKKISYSPPYTGHFFIAKYDSNLVLLWAKNSQSAIGAIGSDIKADDSGCVFTGYYTGQTTFETFVVNNPANDPNSNSISSSNVFLGRIEGNGTCRFFKNAGKGLIETKRMEIALSHDIYLTGYAGLFLPPEKDSSGICCVGPSTYICDKPQGFLSKYSSDGKFLWVRKIENTISDCNAIAIKNSTDEIVTGGIIGINDYNSLLIPTCLPGFIYKYSNNGDSLRTEIYKPFNSIPYAGCGLGDFLKIMDLGVAKNGGLFVAGKCFPGFVFGSDTLQSTGSGAGNSDLGFICSYLPNGDKKWVSNLSWKQESDSNRSNYSLNRFAFNGNQILAAGTFSKIVTDDSTVNSRGNNDIYIARIIPKPKNPVRIVHSTMFSISSLKIKCTLQNGFVCVQMENQNNQFVTALSVINTLGKRIISTNFVTPIKSAIRIPFSNLSNGVYFITVSTKTQTVVKSIALSSNKESGQ